MKCDQVCAALSIVPALQHSAHRGHHYYLLGQDLEEIVPERGEALHRFHGSTTSSELVPQMSLSLYLSTPNLRSCVLPRIPGSLRLCRPLLTDALWSGSLGRRAVLVGKLLGPQGEGGIPCAASGVRLAPTQTLSSSEHKALRPCKPEFL